MKVLGTEQSRALEQSAVERQGVSLEQLMENAGGAITRFLRKRFTLADKHIVVLCGCGNNGGDGFVAARMLSDLGAMVVVVLTDGQPQRGEAQKAFESLSGTRVRVIDMAEGTDFLAPMCVSSDFIIDAIYGVGFHGELPEKMQPVLRALRGSRATVVSVDIPSGVVCDTGAIGEAGSVREAGSAGKADSVDNSGLANSADLAETSCVKAAYTVSMSTLKNAHLLQPGKSFCGQVVVVPIGIDASLIAAQKTRFEITDQSMVQAMLAPRAADSNKGSYGRLLCVCGSNGMAGAAALSAMAAVRCGVGLVDVALPRPIYQIVASNVLEPVYTLLDYSVEGTLEQTSRSRLEMALKDSTGLLLGCGIGYSEELAKLTAELLGGSKSPVVLDADGINIVAQNIDILKTAKAPLILTPHPGEMARLAKKPVAEVQAHRMEYARDFAAEYGVVIALKGAGTIVAAPDGRVFLNTTGNPGMAKAGSGDVLAGMAASFAAQGIEPVMAAAGAVYLHGMAGDHCAAALSQTGMTPMDMIGRLPELFLEMER